MHDCFSVTLQEVDNLTREKIQDELKELKEAHAADEGAFFPFSILINIQLSHLLLLETMNFWYGLHLKFI